MPARITIFRVVVSTLQEINGPALRKPTIWDYARLLGAAALWGSSFLLNELALKDFSPIAIATYRISLAALALCAICYWLGLRVQLTWRSTGLLFAIGVLNSVIPFSLIGWGQLRIDSATTAILLATTPFSTLLFSHFMTRDDRFTWSKLIGLVFGFLGVVALLGLGASQGRGSVAGMLVVILAGCCYSLSSLLIRKLRGMNTLLLVAGSLLAGAAASLPILLLFYPPWQQSYEASSLAALLGLALGPTAIAYVLRAQIVQLNGAVFMSNVGYLIPLFAVFWGWVFLSQQPSLVMWLALALILSGIAVGQWRKSS